MTNLATTDVTVSATLQRGSNSYFTVSVSGPAPPQGTATITITPKAIPQTSATTADLYGDVLRVSTSAVANDVKNVALHMTARGAILTFEPTSITFGTLDQGTFTSQGGAFYVRNAGNVDAGLLLTKGGDNPFAFTINPTLGTAPAGASFASQATFYSFYPTGEKHATVSVATNAVRCAPIPAPLQLTGRVR